MTIKYGGARKVGASLTIAVLSLLPVFAFASSFSDKAVDGRAQAAALSQSQLDGLNTGVFKDAWVAAKIVGYDRSELDQLKNENAQLRADVQQLKDQMNSLDSTLAQRLPTQSVTTVAPASAVDARMTALETKFDSLQGTLGAVVSMLTLLLGKM